MKMLGVTVTKTLSMAEHVRAIIHNCASSLHALRVLRSQRRRTTDSLSSGCCHQTDICYQCLPTAWWGFSRFTTVDDRLRIERFLRRETRSGFYRPDWPSVEILAESAADALFRRVLGNRNHLLHLGYCYLTRTGTVTIYDTGDMTAFLHLIRTSEILLTGSCINTVINYIYISFIVELRSVISYY